MPVLTVLHACHHKRASGIVFDGRRRETRPTTVLEGSTGSRNKDARPFWCKAPSCKIDFLLYLDSCVRSGSISDNVLISVPPPQFFFFFLAFALTRKTKGVLMSGARRGALEWSVHIRSPCDNKRQEPIIQWFKRICTRARAVVAVVAVLHACH